MAQENVNIGSSKENYKDVAVTFKYPFADVPETVSDTILVTATIVLDAEGYPLDRFHDAYTVNVANVTRTGFVARVRRVDANAGWHMNLTLNYIASQQTV